jgi:hypothetical protein
MTWRAFRQMSRRGSELSGYATAEALELARLTEQLNQHGFELEHTATDLGPKLEQISLFLQQPLVGVALPWVLRRLLARPYRRR